MQSASGAVRSAAVCGAPAAAHPNDRTFRAHSHASFPANPLRLAFQAQSRSDAAVLRSKTRSHSLRRGLLAGADSRLRRLLLRLDGANLDVAEGYLAVIALEGEPAAIGLGKPRHLAEFALCNAVVEVFAAEDVFHILHAVHFVRAFLRA